MSGPSSAWSSATTNRCCTWRPRSCRAARWPRRSSRTPGWLCCAAWKVSRDARRSRPGCSASSSTRARTTGTHEQRSVPVADPEPAVDPSRFDGSGGWADPPERWIEAAEGRIEAGKLAGRIKVLIDELPTRQREVVILRDVEEMTSEEVCSVLAISDGNQRVLLHRGRSRLRQLFEHEF